MAPLSVTAVNTGIGTYATSDTVHFAIADPTTFAAGASALMNLGGGGGSSDFVWGMPFFYGRKVYVGIDQRASSSYIGPFYAY